MGEAKPIDPAVFFFSGSSRYTHTHNFFYRHRAILDVFFFLSSSSSCFHYVLMAPTIRRGAKC